MTLSNNLCAYLALRDHVLVHADLPKYSSSRAYDEALDELQALWDVLSPMEREYVYYYGYCGDYTNNVEHHILRGGF